jgi:prepilin-type N-terminal cleavage/methylation domain-containing protein
MRLPVARSGFTFIEVLACLLVLSLGIASAVGMVMYGVVLATRAQGRATGMATALTVAVDPAPLLPKGSTWSGGGGREEARGYINGYYVIRHETLGDGPAPGFHSNTVTVDVYDTFKGSPVTSYTTRVLRQDPP